MGRPQLVSDGQIVAALERIRADEGTCTIRRLAAEVGLHPSSLDARVRKLLESGVLERRAGPSSLRAVRKSPIRPGTLSRRVS